MTTVTKKTLSLAAVDYEVMTTRGNMVMEMKNTTVMAFGDAIHVHVHVCRVSYAVSSFSLCKSLQFFSDSY